MQTASFSKRNLLLFLLTLAVVCGLFALSATRAGSQIAPEYFVSPLGNSQGDGSREKPWDLETALAHPEVVRPGSVIWLRGGTYSGTFTSELRGTEGAPIIVRQARGERATIDSGTSADGSALTVHGSDVWFWDFEIKSSGEARWAMRSGSHPGISRVQGIRVFAPRSKFINLAVHDTAGGFGFWSDAVDSEIYGCLIYYNGWQGPDRGHGHGIYTQNEDGLKWIEDNIQFAGFAQGIRAYGTEKADARGYRFIGNISFNSGVLSGEDKRNSNFFVTVANGASDIVFEENHSYHPPATNIGRANIGWVYSGVEKDFIARRNHWIGGDAAVEVWNWDNATFVENTMYAHQKMMLTLAHHPEQMISEYEWDDNTYYGSGRIRLNGRNTNWSGWQSRSGLDGNSSYERGRPKGTWKFVRPNRYEPGRAHIVIYNWDREPSVEVDLDGVLRPGMQFEVRDAQNYFGEPVFAGVFDGEPVALPTQGLELAKPVGQVKNVPAHTAPDFVVFVVVPVPLINGVQPAQATPAPEGNGSEDNPADESHVGKLGLDAVSR